MNRPRLLLPATAALVVAVIVYHVWAGWGLVTIHSQKEPLSKVIRELEKQGHITLKTDLDLSMPVHMDVDKVVVAEALETLAAVTDGRWRLAFLVAGDKGAIGAAVASLTAGQRPEGWKMEFVPAPPVGEQPEIPPDPRRDVWTVSAPAEPKVQAYLDAAARQVSAMFFFPESWNPQMKSPPKTGTIAKVLPKLASAAGGQSETLFLLQKNGGRVARGGEEDGGGRPDFMGGGGGGRGFNREAMEARMNAEISKLPAGEQPAAQAQLAEGRAFFAGMKDLTPEQRRAKMEEFMADPSRQEKMEARMAAADARRSPEQRLARAHGYADRKAQVRNGGGK